MAPQARPGAAETTTVPIVVLDEQKKKPTNPQFFTKPALLAINESL